MSEEFMHDDLFAELLESVREGGAILRGEKETSRAFAVEPPVSLHSCNQCTNAVCKHTC